MTAAPRTTSPAIAAWAFFVSGNSLLSRLIMRVTGPWSHCGIGFTLKDAGQVYYESLFARGVVGPRCQSRLSAWAARSASRHLDIVPLPLTPLQAESCRLSVQRLVGRAGYAELQILAMWASRRFGWPIPASINRVVCSELLSRALSPWLDLRDDIHPTHDHVTPYSAYQRLRQIRTKDGLASHVAGKIAADAKTRRSARRKPRLSQRTAPSPLVKMQGITAKMQGMSVLLPQLASTPGGQHPMNALLLANSAPESSSPPQGPSPQLPPDATVAMVNAFALAEDPSRPLIPYADVPYDVDGVKGIQRLNPAVASHMVNLFRSWRGKLTRRFGGLPFYIGHPDHPAFANRDTDVSAYGWIMGLDAVADGLLLTVDWSDDGKSLLANKRYKWFSPNFLAREAGSENGERIFEPLWIQSCGLTNSPNWPVHALVNTQRDAAARAAQQKEKVMLEFLRTLFGVPEDTDEAAVQALVNEAKAKGDQVDAATAEKTAAEEQVTALANEKTALETQLGQAVEARDAAVQAQTAERTARIEALVNAAVADGRVTPAAKQEIVGKLTENFDAAVVELANMQPAIKTASVVEDLGRRNSDAAENHKGRRILQLVNERMESTHLAYDDAWAAIKREHPALFETT